MKRVLTKTDVKERFIEHDLRAKNASDEKDERVASKRKDHSSQQTTHKVYRRKAELSESLSPESIGLSGLILKARSSKEDRDTIRKNRYKGKVVRLCKP